MFSETRKKVQFLVYLKQEAELPHRYRALAVIKRLKVIRGY